MAPAGKQYSQLLILSWEPGLGMCWYRGKLGSHVRWGWEAQGHLSEDKGDGWHPVHIAFWPLLKTVSLGQRVCSGPSAQVNQSSPLHSQNS